MKILIVTASWMEVKLIADELKQSQKTNNKYCKYHYAGNDIDILVTGIGAISATFHLTSVLLENFYNLVLNIGIAGSLNRNLKIGEVVNVISEKFVDLGIEKEDGFYTLFDSGFLQPNEFPFEEGLLKSSFTNGWVDLKKVNGATSSKYHTHIKKRSNFQEKLSADVENMEGAAVFYVCHNLKIPCLQIRAISNYITPKGLSEWDIPLALINLKSSILKQIRSIAVPVSWFSYFCINFYELKMLFEETV